MDAALYILFSMIEGFSIIVFILLLFRINPREYVKEITLCNTVISTATYFFQENGTLSSITPFLSVVLLLFFLIFIFKISLLHSIYVSVIGFISCSLIQGFVIYIPTIFSDITLSMIREDHLLGRVFQLISSATMILTGLLLYRKGYGFHFVPYTPSFKFKFTRKNIVIIFFSIVGVSLIGIILEIDEMFIGISLLLMMFVVLLRLGIKRQENGGFD